MYSDNPVINDIVLAIINDSNGSQCGMTYEDRCANVHNASLSRRLFREGAVRYTTSREYLVNNEPVKRGDIITAAKILLDYYREHLADYVEYQRIKSINQLYINQE